MKHFTNFILEKLKITTDTKVRTKNDFKDLSEVKIPGELYQDLMSKTPSEEATNHNKMAAYKKKGSKPTRLLGDIKNKKKLVSRWYIAITINWLECAKVFKQGIIERGYYSEDELDAYVLSKYKSLKKYGLPNVIKGIEEYLDYYGIKYEK